jgi:hypothetical protein
VNPAKVGVHKHHDDAVDGLAFAVKFGNAAPG